MEPLPVDTIDAERDELVQPGHQQSRPVLPDTEHLGRFGVDRVGEPLRVEAVTKHSHVLPEQLIQQKVGVGIDRRDRDVTFWFAAAQHIRTEEDDVADLDGPLSELAEQDR